MPNLARGFHMKVRRLGPVLLIGLAIATLNGAAHADGVPITGTAGEFPAVDATFAFSGPGISVFSTTVDFPQSPVLVCNLGSFCNMTIAVPSAVNFDGPGFLAVSDSMGSVLGMAVNAIGGGLIFAGSAFIPTTLANNTISVPVALAGTIQGFNVTDCPGTCTFGNPIWNLLISGTGEATFSAFPNTGDFADVQYTFSGTAINTPEPASLLLLGTGLLGVACYRRRAKRKNLPSTR